MQIGSGQRAALDGSGDGRQAAAGAGWSAVCEGACVARAKTSNAMHLRSIDDPLELISGDHPGGPFGEGAITGFQGQSHCEVA
jgi:hypothetical protein